MLNLFKSFEKKYRRNTLRLNLEDNEKVLHESNKIISLLENDKLYDKATIELSINEYASKIKKQLILIEKLKLNNNRQKNIINQNLKIKSEKTLLYNRYSIRSKEELFKQIRKSTIHDISNIIWNEQPDKMAKK